ncbi:MAG: RNA polymerase sigma factor [Verrucomicrobiales bacterium]
MPPSKPDATDHADDSPITAVSSVEAYGRWVEATIVEHYPQLYRFALSLSGKEADAADLTQQTAVILATKGREIRDTSQVKAWLYTTLHREFLHQRRRGQRLDLHEPGAAILDGAAAQPARQEGDFDARAAVAALRKIGEPHQTVLALYYLEDLSYREIAGVLDVPVGTVMSRLSRAKDVLREYLNPSLA